MFVVVVTEKGGSQQRIELETDAVSIGRVHGNEIVLPRGNVSKQHATISVRDGAFHLSDLGSTNGTFVNGRRIQTPQTVNPGDKIYVGDFILHIEEMEKPGIRLPVTESRKSGAMPAVQMVSEKAEKAPPPTKPNRPSVPPPSAARGTERPSEKRVRVPKLSPQAGPPAPTVKMPAMSTPVPPPRPSAPSPPLQVPISPKRPAETQKSSNITFKQLLADAAIQLGVSELADGPVALMPEKAAKLRRVLKSLVDAVALDGAIPPSHTAATYRGAAYRKAVDLGAIGTWLSDPDIFEIRIFGTHTAALKTAGGWNDVDNPFETEEELLDVAARLEAGIERRGHRYDLEDGFAVFRSDTPRHSLVINKRWHIAPPAEPMDLFGDTERQVLLEAISANAKIAVLGRSPAARSAVLCALARLIPRSAFVAAVGRTDCLCTDYPNVMAILPENINRAKHHFAAAMDDACDAAPDWLLISDASWRHIAAVLATATSRVAIIANLPIGAIGRINRELSVALISSGLSTTPGQAALYMKEAFDIVVVVADGGTSGTPCVETILATELSDRGSWAPRTLFKRA